MAVSAWSTNATLNVTVGGANIAEGCSPAGINDALRGLMAEARTKFDETDAVLATGTIAAAVGTRIYATKAALSADLTPADGLYALVTDDATASLNGLYKKSGATGVGTWGGPSSLFNGAAAAFVAPQVTAAQASAVSAAASAVTAQSSVSSIAGYATSASGSAIAAAGSASAAAGSAVTAANSIAGFGAVVTTAQNTVSAIKQSALDAIAGLPISATLPLQAVSRSAMAAFTGMSTGRQALLSEAGRDGLFVFSAANNATNVTADPYQTIYVPPASDTTGASGAWVRNVRDSIYLGSWWGMAASVTDNGVLIQNAIYGTLIPDGSILRLPAASLPMTTGTSGQRSNITIEGYGKYVTKLVMNTLNAVPMTQQGDNITWRGFWITGNSAAAFSNAPPCAHLGLGATATVWSNWTVEDMGFDGAGIGLICTASNSTTVLSRPKNIRIRRCHFATKGQGLSLFGVTDARVDDCTLDMVANTTPNNECEGIRVLGSSNVTVRNVKGTVSNQFAIRIDDMNRTTTATTLHQSNDNIRFFDCDFDNANQSGVTIQSGLGDISFERVTFRGGSLSDTTARTAIVFETTGDSTERVQFKDCRFIGYNQLMSNASTNVTTYFRMRGCEWIANKATSPASGIQIEFGNIVLGEFERNNFLTPPLDVIIRAPNYVGNARILRVISNTLPEGTSSFLVHQPSASAVKVQLSTGDLTASGSNGVIGSTASDNLRYAAGSFAIVNP